MFGDLSRGKVFRTEAFAGFFFSPRFVSNMTSGTVPLQHERKKKKKEAIERIFYFLLNITMTG